MILYIDEALIYCEPNDPSISDEDLDYITEEAVYIQKIFDQYSINAVVDNQESGLTITIYPQKITLDNFNMNNLFSNVIHELFYKKYILEYVYTENNMCYEFAMRIIKHENI